MADMADAFNRVINAREGLSTKSKAEGKSKGKGKGKGKG